MANNATQIVHKLNELIAEAETRSQSLELAEISFPINTALDKVNHYKRAIGQLKAARASFIASRDFEVAA